MKDSSCYIFIQVIANILMEIHNHFPANTKSCHIFVLFGSDPGVIICSNYQQFVHFLFACAYQLWVAANEKKQEEMKVVTGCTHDSSGMNWKTYPCCVEREIKEGQQIEVEKCPT